MPADRRVVGPVIKRMGKMLLKTMKVVHDEGFDSVKIITEGELQILPLMSQSATMR